MHQRWYFLTLLMRISRSELINTLKATGLLYYNGRTYSTQRNNGRQNQTNLSSDNNCYGKLPQLIKCLFLAEILTLLTAIRILVVLLSIRLIVNQ